MRQLTPQKRELFREILKEIAELPSEKRRAVRRAIQTLRGMAPERREEMLASEGFARKIGEADQGLIRQALSVLP
jgi:phage-related protein